MDRARLTDLIERDFKKLGNKASLLKIKVITTEYRYSVATTTWITTKLKPYKNFSMTTEELYRVIYLTDAAKSVNKLSIEEEEFKRIE
ncbi:MAG: hypothetical protein ACYC21_14860 [Eubacteriales bacterium]